MKKQSKKLLAVLTVFAVMFGLMSASVYAAGTTISVDSINASAGETVTVNMKLDGTFNANAVTETLTFDKEKLEAVSIVAGEVYNNSSLMIKDLTDDAAVANANGQIVVVLGGITDAKFESGVIATIKFKVKENVSGTQALSLESEIGNEAGDDLTDTTVKTESGKITVVIPVSKVTLSKTTLTLNVDASETITATVEPENATESKTVTWASSDEKIAKVENGKITAVAPGKATITAKAGSKTATCTVEVKAPLKSIALDKDFELFLGDSKDLTVTYTPANTTDSKTATWTSSNAEIVKVENGKVTALKIGEATITAKVGEYTATTKITVPEVLLEGIKITQNAEKVYVEGNTSVIVETIPARVTEKVEVSFKSSDEKIAKVDENGKVIGVKPGKVTITATVNEKYTKTAEIEVIEKPAPKPADYRENPYTGNALRVIFGMDFESAMSYVR